VTQPVCVPHTPLPCAGRTELMFSGSTDDQEEALELCTRCGSVVRCAVVALRRRERFGVWGGFTAAEREAIVAAIRLRVQVAA
jgi:hypothetical protein